MHPSILSRNKYCTYNFKQNQNFIQNVIHNLHTLACARLSASTYNLFLEDLGSMLINDKLIFFFIFKIYKGS